MALRGYKLNAGCVHPYLQGAGSKEDKLESGFERAVMLFVRGEYRASIVQLHEVQVRLNIPTFNLETAEMSV